MALAQPPWGHWPLFFIAGPVALWLWRAGERHQVRHRAQFAIGWAIGAGYFTVALHWIIEPFLVDAARHGWMAPFALVLLCGGLALFWGAAFALAAAMVRRVKITADWAGACALIVFWSLAEITRSYIFTGFPWALPVYGWLDTPVAQVGAVIGPYALSALTLTAMVFLGLRSLLFPGVSVALFALAWGYGTARLDSEAAQAAPDGAVVRVLQTAVDQNEKWAPENVRPNFDMLLQLSEAPPKEPGAMRPGVIVWPESAVTFILDRDAGAVEEIAARLPGREVATGALRHADGPFAEITRQSRWRNSLFMVGVDGGLSAPFDKVHLVPFGEYLPFDGFFNALGVVGLGSLGGGLVAGDAPVVMSPANAPAFAPLICYEMIFAGETMTASEGADWMVLVTNDSWFGGGAGLVQHLAKARMRAIETGAPIARSANAGISAIIDPFGRTGSTLEAGRQGFVDGALPRRVATAYRAYGEIFTTLALLLLVLAATAGRKTR